ncbi:hypothetical protein NC99_29640 [Sunxiuqinia dokdonensis]|uniref:Uncharacterized protein n=1 Tax=Sunxiuqinia dokdonensis TaxID=1409788 RepID=A0A0L8V7C8_9BACT|nr:hypothetical protein NC99_29640 [Sunxiuqinia dokdonensis]
MVGSAIDCKHFLPFVLGDAGYVFVEFFFPAGIDEGIAILHGKNDLDVNLGECISHMVLF